MTHRSLELILCSQNFNSWQTLLFSDLERTQLIGSSLFCVWQDVNVDRHSRKCRRTDVTVVFHPLLLFFHCEVNELHQEREDKRRNIWDLITTKTQPRNLVFERLLPGGYHNQLTMLMVRRPIQPDAHNVQSSHISFVIKTKLIDLYVMVLL